MIDVFRSLKSLVKVSHITTDSQIFRLHYSFTVITLLAFCIIVTTRQYVGDPIDCVKFNDQIPSSLLNLYCWIHKTYYIKHSLGKRVGIDVPAPGIDFSSDPSEFRYHKYYQWVAFVLFLQSALFYTPRWLWKIWEGGKIGALVMDLDVGLCDESTKRAKKKLLVDYLYTSRGHHDWYAGRYFFCELLALVNVVGQMFLLDDFFDGEFLTYGLQVIEFHQMDQEDRVDPMIRIFPRMTKCKFHYFGPSASLMVVDALCILPLNIINEKIFIFLWFWFVTLAVLSSVLVLFRLVIVASPPVRVYLLNLRFRFAKLDHLHTVVRRTSIGDWFLVYMLGQNIDSVIFKDVIEDLANKGTSEVKET